MNDKLDTYVLTGGGMASGGISTFFIFVDLPKHFEFRVADLPLLEEGTLMDFDLTLKSIRNPLKTIEIKGSHVLQRRILKYGGKKLGMNQFLEWRLVK